MIYKEHILTGMKKLLVTLDDDMAKVLDKYPNKSQVIREALKIYNEHISTDTIEGLRMSYKHLLKNMDERFNHYDACFERMDKLISVLETRM
jgi:Arc/MetJ-type ribon-helix-helix transcriptional regulator